MGCSRSPEQRLACWQRRQIAVVNFCFIILHDAKEMWLAVSWFKVLPYCFVVHLCTFVHFVVHNCFVVHVLDVHVLVVHVLVVHFVVHNCFVVHFFVHVPVVHFVVHLCTFCLWQHSDEVYLWGVSVRCICEVHLWGVAVRCGSVAGVVRCPTSIWEWQFPQIKAKAWTTSDCIMKKTRRERTANRGSCNNGKL